MAKKKVDTIDRADLAASYGWALSVLKSHPSLSRLFDKAVANTWTPQRFIAELRSTSWYKNNSESMRNALIMKTSDKRTWVAKTAQTQAAIKDMATQMGAQFSKATLAKLADNVMMFGWNDNQIRDVLSQSVKLTAAGNYAGQAAVTADQLRESAMNNGVKISDSSLSTWVRRVAAGEPIEGFETYVRDMAAGAFPAWADQVKAGRDVKDLASPYMEQMAKTLEMNVNDIDLFDPTIRKTFQATDDKGAPVSKPMYQFETELKKDQRWKYTDGARNELDAVGRGVLKDFGLVA